MSELLFGSGAGAYESPSPSAPEETYHFTKDGLKLWLKADAITGLADDDPVATWNDSSGNGNNATQATEANKPLYKTNILNGQPVVRFDGTNDFLRKTSAAGLAAATAASAFAVVRVVDTGGTPYICNYAADKITFYATSAEHLAIQSSGDIGYSVHRLAVSQAATWVVASATIDRALATNEAKLWVNSTPGDTYDANANNTVAFGAGAWTVGASDSDAALFNGDIAEVLVYNSALSIPQLQQVNRYLGNKYGITVG